ncbi:MAG: hypothetical protein ACTSXH_06400 [Promethearchaeota archaeon]
MDDETPKQFILTTSFQFQSIITDELHHFHKNLMLEEAKERTLAKKYNISQARVTTLRLELEVVLQSLQGLGGSGIAPSARYCHCHQ